MALVPATDLYFPPPPPARGYNNWGSWQSSVIDATGEKFAFMGRVWFPARTGSKDIRKAHFRFGTVVKAGGSALTVSLQDVDVGSSVNSVPDGTQDQTVAIANANAGLTSNSWFTTGNFSADRTVAFGDLLALVIEYDGSGRLGSDSVAFTNFASSSSSGTADVPGQVPLLHVSSWNIENTFGNNCILEFSDGTFGRLDFSSIIASVAGSQTANTGSTPDEIALKFTPGFACGVDGIWFSSTWGSGADFDVVLYDGTTPLKTVSFPYRLNHATGKGLDSVAFAEVSLNAGTTYYAAIKPTSANNVTVGYFDVAAAAHLDVLPGGQAFHYAERTDGGAWTATTTRRPLIGLRISAIDDGAGGGGGGGAHIIGGSIVR